MKLFNNKIYLRKTKKVDMFTINNKLRILAFFAPLLILLIFSNVLLYNNINKYKYKNFELDIISKFSDKLDNNKLKFYVEDQYEDRFEIEVTNLMYKYKKENDIIIIKKKHIGHSKAFIAGFIFILMSTLMFVVIMNLWGLLYNVIKCYKIKIINYDIYNCWVSVDPYGEDYEI
jgi:hypothetical protein